MAAGGAVLAAVLVNEFLTPRVAAWCSARTPVEQFQRFDETRVRATRHVATSFLAGLIGPAGGEASQGAAESSGASGAPGGPAGEDRPSREPGQGAEVEDERRGGARNQGGRTGAGRDAATSGSKGAEQREARSSFGSGRDGAAEVPEETPTFELDRRDINRRLEDPEGVRQAISTVANEEPPGLRILKLQGYWGKFGLQPGDVVVSVNGQKVPTRQRAIAYLLQNRRRTSFRVEVRRNGETFRIRYRVPHVD